MNDNAEQKPGNDNRSLTGKLLLLAVVMFGFGFMLVPLVQRVLRDHRFRWSHQHGRSERQENPDFTRSVRIEFVTTVNNYAPWQFAADRDSMEVTPGKMYYATFTATNLAGET